MLLRFYYKKVVFITPPITMRIGPIGLRRDVNNGTIHRRQSISHVHSKTRG